MSELSGSLADFALRDVVHLLSAGAKTGILVVKTRQLRGSVFFDEGLLTYATTRSGTAELVDVDRRDHTSEEEAKQRIVGVVVRLLRSDDGSFVFENGVAPVHATEGSFAAADIIAGAEELMEAWEPIEKAIGSVDTPHRLRPDADENELLLSLDDWRTIAAVAAARSAVGVSLALGISEFAAAESMADLCGRGLIEPTEDEADAVAPPASEVGGAHTSRESSGEFEYYVNSHGTALREPLIPQAVSEPEPASEPIDIREPAAYTSEVVLDLTESRYTDDDPADIDAAPSLQARRNNVDEEPASELARRWREMRAARD